MIHHQAVPRKQSGVTATRIATTSRTLINATPSVYSVSLASQAFSGGICQSRSIKPKGSISTRIRIATSPVKSSDISLSSSSSKRPVIVLISNIIDCIEFHLSRLRAQFDRPVRLHKSDLVSANSHELTFRLAIDNLTAELQI